MKRRISVAAICFLLLSAASLAAAYNIHCFLSGQPEQCTVSVVYLLEGVATLPEVRKWFLLLVALSALGTMLMCVDSKYPEVKSEMYSVTPGIKTPKAYGQGQFGTAQWLEPCHFSDAFEEVLVDVKTSQLRRLMEEGYDDLKGGASGGV